MTLVVDGAFLKFVLKAIDVRKNVRYNFYDIKNLVIPNNDRLEELAIIQFNDVFY